jgi:YidC/Oxa1 family membrane protein insertase
MSDDGFKSGHLVKKVLEGEIYTDDYYANLTLPAQSVSNYTFYFGPNQQEYLETYNNDMESIVNLGWGIFRWVNQIMIQPMFDLLRGTGLGMGLIILLVTLFVKIIITPLTYKNYKSSAKMRVLKPEIDKINEKYVDKKDPMKKQKETMALYKATGVNPMAGCLPMIIQMPILLAVFRFFPSSIHLRHESFLWADDLSSFDSVWDFGFNIPMYGDHMSLFAILMAISTLFYTIMNSSQMNTSQPGMPNMKIIMYFFPVMMLVFFNSYSAGLSYYYLCGNLMNMAIMWAIKRYMIDEDKILLQLAENKKKPKKQSAFQKRLEDMSKKQQHSKKKK